MDFFKSLKVQIVIFVFFITFFSGLVISFTNYWESKSLLHKRLEIEIKNSSFIITNSIDENLSESGNMVRYLARQRGVENFNIKSIKEMSHILVQFTDIFYNIYVYDRKGDLISADYFDNRHYKPPENENLKKYNNIFKEYALKVYKDGKPRFTDTFKAKSNNLLIAYINPIKDKAGKIIGIVSCGIYVFNPKLQKLLNNLKPAYNGFIILTDKNGNILGKAGNLPKGKKTVDISKLKKDFSKNLSLWNYGGKLFRFSLNKIREADMYVVVAIPEQVVKDILSSYLKEVLFYNGISLLVVILLSLVFSNFLVNPINSLVKGLQEAGTGNYSYRIKTRSNGEIKSAINAYNEMMEKLQKNKVIEKIWNDKWKS